MIRDSRARVAAPAWVLAKLAEEAEHRPALVVADEIPAGDRDETLFRLGCALREKGLGEAEIRAALVVVNAERCKPPLDAAAVVKCARSAARYQAGELPNPARPAAATGEATPLSFVSLESVTMRAIEWLEKPLWQRSTFHLLVGSTGSGKGTYSALLIAKMTRGDLGDPQNVVIVSSEDSVEVDIKPRLVLVGADITRCKFITEQFRLPADLGRLRATVEAIGDVGLVIIDPVSNHVGARSTDSESEVRDAISGLNAFADDLRCLVIGVRHFKKDHSGGPLSSVLGSTAWVDLPRAVIGIAEDDDDEDVRHIQIVKGNRSRRGAGVMFRIETGPVDGLDEEVTRAAELGASTKKLENLFAAAAAKMRSETKQAKELPADKAMAVQNAILDVLEESLRGFESDALDALIARQVGVTARQARGQRDALKDMGLVKAVPEQIAEDGPRVWMMRRTGAPR